MYTGPLHDRRFMFQKLSDKGEWANMAVARETEMCLFTTHVPGSAGASEAEKGIHEGGLEDLSEVEVRFGLDHCFKEPSKKLDGSTITVPLHPDVQGLGLEEAKINMHNSPTTAYDMGSTYNTWFSERFGYTVRLLYIGENKRLVLGNMPPNIAGLQMEKGTRGEGVENTYEKVIGNGNVGGGWLGSLTGAVKGVLGGGENKENERYEGVDQGLTFSDIAPYLVISSKSWEDAQRRLPEGEKMDISKFRPNIIVEGADEIYEEDYWAEIQIGEKAVIVLTQNCARCNSLNVDYETGKVGVGESGKILKKLNSDRRVDLGAKWSPVFGRYGFLKRLDGSEEGVRVSVGDEVKVIKKNDARTRFGKLMLSLFCFPEQ